MLFQVFLFLHDCKACLRFLNLELSESYSKQTKEFFFNFFFLIYTANCASCEIHVKFMWNSCLYHVKVMFILSENRVKNFTWKSCTFSTNLTWISCKAKCLWNKEFWKFYYFLFLLKLLKKVNKLTFYK